MVPASPLSPGSPITPMTPMTPMTPNKAAAKKATVMNDFRLVTVLGRGSYGKVVKCMRKKDSELVALKMMNKAELAKDDVLEWVRQEEKVVAMLQTRPHPFVCKVHETFRTKALVVHVMEFLPGGDLLQHLKRARGGRLPVADAKVYFAEVALALHHLHSHHIIYRDLKPDNVLLGTDGHVALADFGFAKRLDPTDPKQTAFCGSLEFLAPEMINSDTAPYSYEVDWWSAAVLFYNLLAGEVPWTSDDSIVCYDKICTAPLPKRKLGREEFSFLSQMLRKDLSTRLSSFEAVKAHPFMRDIDWDQLLKGDVPPPFVPDLTDDDTKYFAKDLTSLPAQVSATKPKPKKDEPAPPPANKKTNGHGEGARKKRK
eukprot:TRINITY_DN2425_c0_g1_i2.p1 TRINITY_DN2425_c0_g1~~TRINITY_DN2425_c0_g1_i2.p1  ORF type:complete len:423 (-),score=156.50 TRINITY_DN2425_c0_g1_i2:846-1958(-)